MTDDPYMDEWAEPLRRWIEAPWWSRWWRWLRLWAPLPRLARMALTYAEDARRSNIAANERIKELNTGVDRLAGVFQGLVGTTRSFVVPEHQETFITAMYGAIDDASSIRSSFGSYAKPETSTDAKPLVCVMCDRTSREEGLRFWQLSDGVHCFECLQVAGVAVVIDPESHEVDTLRPPDAAEEEK